MPRRLAGQALRHGAQGFQRLDPVRAVQALGRSCFYIRGANGDAERLGARHAAQEAQHRQQLGRLVRRQGEPPDLRRAHETAALARIVPDREVVEPLAAHLERLALREERQRSPRAAGQRPQRRVVLHDDGEALRLCQQGNDERDESKEARHCFGPPPRSVAPMKPESAGGGAMITWILSESLSASVF